MSDKPKCYWFGKPSAKRTSEENRNTADKCSQVECDKLKAERRRGGGVMGVPWWIWLSSFVLVVGAFSLEAVSKWIAPDGEDDVLGHLARDMARVLVCFVTLLLVAVVVAIAGWAR